ncbi:hypothetical protein BpHYR1_014702 [Brachionus plicatilis]|uniref:Uncharacterized protein n=1 Tax=Brachionus plicatilis TaxID=10195 RepID=A0A3M7QHV5_BRAPC|nr:hypothetical protein BpHYR1_014702 [Brachionus plicatilis]
MKGYQVFLAIFCIIYAQLSSVQSLSCKVGFGISEPGSHELKTYFDNTVTANNCGTSSASNPSSEPKGCMKNVFKLSGGNLYVEYACFTGTTKATEVQYDPSMVSVPYKIFDIIPRVVVKSLGKDRIETTFTTPNKMSTA